MPPDTAKSDKLNHFFIKIHNPKSVSGMFCLHFFGKRMFEWLFQYFFMQNPFKIFQTKTMYFFQKNILTLLFLLFHFCLFSQRSVEPATLNWGDEYNEPAGTQIQKIIGIQKDGFFTLRAKLPSTNNNSRPRVYLEYFDKKMKLKKSNEVDLKYKGKRRDFEDIIMLGGQLYLMTSFNNQGKQKNYLFKQKISMRSLLPMKTLQMVAETEARNKETEGTFGFNIARDSSALLIYNQLPYKKKDPERFALHVFDKDFEKLWHKDIELPYPDHSFTVEEYRVDKQGNVYLLGVIFQDQAGFRRRGAPNYEYVILAYTNDGTDVEEYRIKLNDKFITDLTFRIADDGNLVCSGFYSEKGTYSIKGTYFCRINSKTKEIYLQNQKEFEFAFLTEYMSEKNKEKARQAERSGNTRRQVELYEYDLDKLILRSDGGAVLVAEQYYVYQERDYNYYPFYGYRSFYRSSYYDRFQYTTYYNYNDILVVNIRPNGEIEWTARIPKKQETTNDGGYFSSYTMSIVRDKLFFVFNDNGRNFSENRKNNRIYNFNGSNSVITLAEVSKGGKVKTFPLYNNRDAAIITRPKVCKQIGSRQMAIYGERGQKFRFASLRFN